MIKNNLRVFCVMILIPLVLQLYSCTDGGNERVDDSTLIDTTVTVETTAEAVTTAVETNAAGRIVLPAVSLDILPEFTGGGAKKDYDCGGGVYMRYVANVFEKEINAYLDVLKESGYSELSSWKIGKNSFSRYVKDTVEVYAYYTLGDASARIIVSPYDSTADARVNNSNTGNSEVLLTQVGINYTNVVNGMSYILRTPTGSFIVIDGGWADQGEAKKILDILQEQNQNGSKPVVAAWILTHPHSDHIGAISEFSTLFYDQVELLRIVFNFVSDATMKASDSVLMITDMNSYYGKIKRALNNKKVWGGVELIKPHTGQTLTFDGVSFTIVETHEDIFPNTGALEYMNAASMAFMVEVVGNRMLFLGDCSASATALIAKRFGDWLKCDYLQPTHHGSTGGNLGLYQYASPEVSLWCSSIPRFEEYKGSDFNKYLLENCKEHYYSGNGDVTLTVKVK